MLLSSRGAVAVAAVGCAVLLPLPVTDAGGGYCGYSTSSTAAAAVVVCPVSRSCCFPAADPKDRSCATGAKAAINSRVCFLPLMPSDAIGGSYLHQDPGSNFQRFLSMLYSLLFRC